VTFREGGLGSQLPSLGRVSLTFLTGKSTSASVSLGSPLPLHPLPKTKYKLHRSLRPVIISWLYLVSILATRSYRRKADTAYPSATTTPTGWAYLTNEAGGNITERTCNGCNGTSSDTISTSKRKMSLSNQSFHTWPGLPSHFIPGLACPVISYLACVKLTFKLSALRELPLACWNGM